MNSVISIVNYGSANIGSISNMLNRLSIPNEIVDQPEQIEKASKLILPGVGAFDNGVNALKRSNLFTPIRHFSQNPSNHLLGICLGMQLLGEFSEEGHSEGLALIPGGCKKFKVSPDKQLKVPHMCWNYISLNQVNHPLFLGLPEPSKFYFVHSYHFVCGSNQNLLASTLYGDMFPSVIGNKNVLGCQFHPEKSHKYGLKILQNFSML